MHKRILLAALVAAAAVVCPAHAAVTSTCNSSTQTGNGATKAFTFSCRFLQNADLSVTVGGVTKTQGVDYTVTGAGNASGTITFTTAPGNGVAVVITRTVDYKQSTDLRSRTYDPNAIASALDKLAMGEQQLQSLYTNPPASVLPANVVAKLNNLRMADQFANIQAAITDAGTAGAVMIPSSYSASDTWTNPNGVPIIDLRGGPGKWRGVVSVRDWGAVGDGSNDDTGSIQSAITAANGGTVEFPSPATSYKVTNTLTVSVAGTKLRGNNSKIYMAFGSAATPTTLFSVTASNVEFDGLWIDSTGTSATTSGNKYAIRYQGSSGTHLTNARVRNCQFTNLPWADVPGVLSTHANYVQWVDGFTAFNNKYDAPSGAAVFLSGVTDAKVLDNSINNTGWYSIQLNDLVDGAVIRGNRITGPASGSRNWGGSVNMMSNSTTGTACGSVGCARIKNVDVYDNYIAGVHSYTAAVQIESCSFVKFHHNEMRDITLTDATPPDFVRVYVRPAAGTTNEGPNDHIEISHNLMVAKGVQNIGVYVDAQDNGSGTLTYSDGIQVFGNQIISVDSSNYIQHGIIFHGQQGGWKNVAIKDNLVTGFPDASGPVSGLIGTVSLSAAPITDIQITGNTVALVGGTGSTSTHLCVAIDAYSQRVQVGGNNVRLCYDGIRTFANASSIFLVSPDLFSGLVNTNYTLGVPFTNRGTVTLSVGSGTATVQANTQCICTETTALQDVKCAVSGTTLTVTGTGSDVINFSCY